MSIILNETKQAEYILESGTIEKKPTATLFLLGKYYRQKENLTISQTIVKLNDFMQQNYKNYNPALWECVIEDITKNSDKYLIREIDSISITRTELDKIANIDNLKYQKLLFTMLCYAKLYNKTSEKNDSWINTTVKEIFRIAKVTVKYKNDKFLYLNDIEKTGLIKFAKKNDNLNIRINFTDNTGNGVLHISDFRELGLEYLNYIGNGKYTKCTECKRLIKKTNNKQIYCSKCAKDIKNLQNKKYYIEKIRK